MPGDPEAESISPEGFASTGGKRFHVHRWFEQVDVDFGWIDLNADQALTAHFDRIVMDLLRHEMKRFGGRGPSEKTLQFIGPRGRKFEARRFMIDSDQGKAQMQVYFDPDPTRLTFHNKKETETRQIRLPMPTPWGSAGWVTIDYVEQFERASSSRARASDFISRLHVAENSTKRCPGRQVFQFVARIE